MPDRTAAIWGALIDENTLRRVAVTADRTRAIWAAARVLHEAGCSRPGCVHGNPDVEQGDLDLAEDVVGAVWPLIAAAKRGHTAGTPHEYLSTSCLHAAEPGREELHGYCQSTTGSNGTTDWTKTPAACKFCDAPCVCTCHSPAGGAQAER